MISIERAKKLLNDKTMSDAEVEEIRDACYALAGIVVESHEAHVRNKHDGSGSSCEQCKPQ